MKMKLILLITFCISSLAFAQYNGGNGSGYGAASSTAAQLSAFLQGPFSGGSMSIALNTNNFIPVTQPYSAAPWNYAGTESVASIPTGVVDWVLVELRKTTAASSVDERRACFILSDGSIVDLDGSSPVKFTAASTNDYYIVIRHRNHLAIMSANSVSLSSSLDGTYLTGGGSEYDFSSAQSQAYSSGSDPMRLISGTYVMMSGDSDKNGSILAPDYSLWFTQNGIGVGYLDEDFDMNGEVLAPDFNLHWIQNNGTQSQVP
ncbi:MAG: hypothetical protein KGZ85_08590 [Ignavibacterium sp.]|nr:hypothetical protein [Ignavibacterium sp.]